MKGLHSRWMPGARVGKGVLTALLLLVMALGRLSVGDGLDDRDPCEREALAAYAKALKLCQLAETGNPRLRCYEAAKAVYLETLKSCQD